MRSKRGVGGWLHYCTTRWSSHVNNMYKIHCDGRSAVNLVMHCSANEDQCTGLNVRTLAPAAKSVRRLVDLEHLGRTMVEVL